MHLLAWSKIDKIVNAFSHKKRRSKCSAANIIPDLKFGYPFAVSVT